LPSVYLREAAGRGVVRRVPGVPVPDDAAGLRAANARLRDLLAERDARIEELTARLAAVGEQVAELQGQVADLAVKAGKSSRNSSKPPSSDGLAKPAPKSLRARSGRKQGRPKGQPGVTMQLSDCPDRVVRHEPACCSAWAAGLAGAAETGVLRRQVTEVPEARAEVTEHQMAGRRCGCGTVTWADAPDGVTAPVQYGPRAAAIAAYLWHGQLLSRNRACAAMADLFGCAPSPGALASMTSTRAVTPALDVIRTAVPARASRTSTRPGSGSREGWPGSTPPRQGSTSWSPCMQSAEGRHGRRRGAAGVRRDRLPRRCHRVDEGAVLSADGQPDFRIEDSEEYRAQGFSPRGGAFVYATSPTRTRAVPDLDFDRTLIGKQVRSWMQCSAECP
jgi:transposase